MRCCRSSCMAHWGWRDAVFLAEIVLQELCWLRSVRSCSSSSSSCMARWGSPEAVFLSGMFSYVTEGGRNPTGSPSQQKLINAGAALAIAISSLWYRLEHHGWHSLDLRWPDLAMYSNIKSYNVHAGKHYKHNAA